MSLTPTTSKKPLPRRNKDCTNRQSFITPTYPIELHHVKALFLARQYRQCIHRCQDLLNPGMLQNGTANVIFLNFYAALCHESLARLMHDFSASKLPALCAAHSLYEIAAQAASSTSQPQCTRPGVDSEALDPAVVSPDTKHIHPQMGTTLESIDEACDAEPTALGVSAIAGDKLQVSHNTRKRAEFTGVVHGLVDMFSRTTTSRERVPTKVSSTPSDNTISLRTNHHFATPASVSRSSSRIQLVDPFYGRPAMILEAESFSADEAVPPPTPPFDESFADTLYLATTENKNLMRDLDHHAVRREPVYTVGAADRYFANLQALEIQLRTHLLQVQTLQSETVNAQTERAQNKRASIGPTSSRKSSHSRSFWSFKDPTVSIAEKSDRIMKGAARGWARERFIPDKYMQLADEALAELSGSL